MRNGVPTEILIESLVASIEKHKREIEELKNERNEYRSKLLAALTGTQILDEARPDFESGVEEDIDVGEVHTAFEVRGALLRKCETIADWARRNDYDPTSVARYLLRWSGKGQRPRGTQTREIIEALEAETGIKICG